MPRIETQNPPPDIFRDSLMPRDFGLEIEHRGIDWRESGEAIRADGEHYRSDFQASTHYGSAGLPEGVLFAMENIRIASGWSSEVSETRVIACSDATVLGEVKTPKQNDLRMLAPVMEAMERAGANVLGGDVGLHTNIDIENKSGAVMDLDALKRLAKLWLKFEPTIFSLLAPSRGSSHWCERFRRLMRGRTTSTADAYLMIDSASRNRLSGLGNGSERGALNLSHITDAQGPRIEFRAHQGTLNPRKAEQWTRLMVALVDCAAKGLEVAPIVDWTETPTVAEMLNALSGAVVSETFANGQRLTEENRTVASGHYLKNETLSRRGAIWAALDETSAAQGWRPEVVRGYRASAVVRLVCGGLNESRAYVAQQVSRWRKRQSELTSIAASIGAIPPMVLEFWEMRQADMDARRSA